MTLVSCAALALVMLAPAPKVTDSTDWRVMTPEQKHRCMNDAPGQVAKLANISIEQATRLVQLATNNRTGVVMRPTTKGAPDLRARGYSPKPETIKYKTCNGIDTQIGAPLGCNSALVLFEPRRPAVMPSDPLELEAMENRIDQRQKEWDGAKGEKSVRFGKRTIQIFRSPECRAVVKPDPKDPPCLVGYVGMDGYVRDASNDQPFTGDLDVFDYLDTKGKPLGPSDPHKQAFDKALQAAPGVDVLHGAHMDWDTSTRDADKYKDPKKREEYLEKQAKNEVIRAAIIDGHRERPEYSPKREPLVVLAADCTVCQAWNEPAPDDPNDKRSAGATWSYPCIKQKSDDIGTDSPRPPGQWPFTEAKEHKTTPEPRDPRLPRAALRYKKGDKLHIKASPASDDASCFGITITKALKSENGSGSYEFRNEGGGTSGDDALALEDRVCAAAPAKRTCELFSVGQQMRIKSNPDGPDTDCFDITITSAQCYSDGTGAYNFKNSGGGQSGDDAESLAARRCH